MRREATSNFSSFLLSLLIFLFIRVREIQARKLEQIVCSSSCGEIKNISYPFRLKGDPAGCGDADYELSCQSNKTILEFHSGKYYVKRISYDQHHITVVDYNLANGSCALPNGSLRGQVIYFDNRDEIFYTGMTGSDYRYGLSYNDYYIANFVSCSSKISDSSYIGVPCLNQNELYVYIQISYSNSYIADLPRSCSFLSTVPISDASEGHSILQKRLQSGFDLAWSVECRNCRKEGGFCLFEGYNGCVKQSPYLSAKLSVLATFLLRVIFTPQELLLILYWFYQIPVWFYELPPWTSDKYLLRAFLDNDQYFPQWISYLPVLLGYHHNLFAVVTAKIIARIILTMVLVVFIIHKYKTTRKTVDIVEKFLYNQQSWMPKRYFYAEILAITSHFRDKLGQGGFGSVYKGQLLNGNLVAVKVLQNSKFSGEEFINEVSTIGRIHHHNVVRLLGFCSEGSKRALIYEFMPNGSLDRHIFSKKGSNQSFSWEKLQEIALGTAQGIEYLHNGCDVCILHFDIKPHNILLDRNFIPKVADFGLAKFYPKENDLICVSAARGTIGYIAPELISRNFGAISCKSDVYSFGMLLLEMAGGRRNSFAKATRPSKAYFPSWVYGQIVEGRDLELQNVSEIEEVIARKLCIIGLWCIQVKATDRPSITKVVEMLEGSIDDLQMPPKPFFSSSPRCNSIREIQSDSSTKLLEYSESIEECSYIDHANDV